MLRLDRAHGWTPLATLVEEKLVPLHPTQTITEAVHSTADNAFAQATGYTVPDFLLALDRESEDE